MIRRAELQTKLLELIASLPEVQVQNRMMATSDRAVALCLFGMTTEEVDRALAPVGIRKESRIRDELALVRTRRVDERHYERALTDMITSLCGGRVASSGRRSYLRPRDRAR
jgi:predicted methyltransferase MtxX (methanogen marker protein 4)